MTIEFKSPLQVAQEYLLWLKGLKPEVNTNQEDSDWYIKGRALGGLISGVYSDQRKIADDAHPQNARREALDRHLFVYFDDTFKSETPSNGFVLVTGATGSFADVGDLELIFESNGNSYVNNEAVTISSPTGGVVSVQSVGTGQEQNLLEGSPLLISSPPAGFDSSATVFGGPLADGSEIETNEEASDRVLTRIRTPIRGGTDGDYEQWAIEADPSVTKATILKFPNGLGTVGVVITAGTTDIDTAIDNGDPIVITPSPQLLQTVKSYIDTKRPLTDCVRVLPPIEVEQDITVKVRFAQGDKDTILSGQTLTQGQLVEREIKRALYKHPVGGYLFGASGYVVASYIEETIDSGVGSIPEAFGSIQLVTDRFIENLSATGRNRTLLKNEFPIPGTITIEEF